MTRADQTSPPPEHTAQPSDLRRDVFRPVWVLAMQFVLEAAAWVFFFVTLRATFVLVRHPETLAAANLEADPDVVRGWYQLLMDQGTYLYMIRTEIIDVPYAVAFGLMIITGVRLLGGVLRRVHPPIARWLMVWAPVFAAANLLDVVENVFSLAMLTDPFGFPEWWASAHAGVARVKVIGTIVCPSVGGVLVLTAVVLGVRRRVRA